jgi:hypothetical protein
MGLDTIYVFCVVPCLSGELFTSEEEPVKCFDRKGSA